MKRTIAMTVAVLMLVTFTVAATALEQHYSLEGKVLGVDYLARTLTMKTEEPLLPSIFGTSNEYTFTLGEMVNVLMCSQNKTFEDINVGDRVKVIYHETEGNLIADTIVMTTPLIACLE